MSVAKGWTLRAGGSGWDGAVVTLCISPSLPGQTAPLLSSVFPGPPGPLRSPLPQEVSSQMPRGLGQLK